MNWEGGKHFLWTNEDDIADGTGFTFSASVFPNGTVVFDYPSVDEGRLKYYAAEGEFMVEMTLSKKMPYEENIPPRIEVRRVVIDVSDIADGTSIRY